MQKSPTRPQIVADLVETARHPCSGASPVVVHAAPGSTVIIYTQPTQDPSKSPTTAA